MKINLQSVDINNQNKAFYLRADSQLIYYLLSNS